MSSGGPSASLKEVCRMGGLLPHCWRAGNFKEFLQGGMLSASRAEVFMLFGSWKDQCVGSGYGKMVFSLFCYHFSLAFWERLRLFQKFSPHADLHFQFAERRVSLLAGMIALPGERGLSGPGEGNSPISSSAFSSPEDFHWDMCLTHLSWNSLFLSSLPEKLWRESACLSRLVLLHFSLLENCFGETFDVGLPAWPQAWLEHSPAGSESGVGVPHGPYQEWIRMFHSCKWYFFE